VAKQRSTSGTTDGTTKQERKLWRARDKLAVAEENLLQVTTKSRQTVERAQQRADKHVAKAMQRVERRRERLSQLEGSVLTSGATVAETPEAVEEQLEEAEATQFADEAVLLPDSDEYDGGLRPRELRALQALSGLDTGATFGQWRLAAGVGETTLVRARQVLLDRGLVQRDGEGGRGTRYLLNEQGRVLASSRTT
jgi:hypothetical protein